MPHSGGGGSCGGGSHGGSFGGSGGGSSHRSSVYVPGCYKYAYYSPKSNKPDYFFSKEKITPETIKKKKRNTIIITIFLAFIYGAIFVSLIKMSFEKPQPVTMDYPKQDIVIEDDLGMLSSAEVIDLKNKLKVFQDKTGITPAVYIKDNSEWKGKYDTCMNYAYDVYLSEFADETGYYDEKHMLILYTQPADAGQPGDGFSDWYYESMLGDDTSGILRKKVMERFNKTFQDSLYIGNITLGGSLNKAFDVLNDIAMERLFDPMLLFAFGFVLVHGSIMFYFLSIASFKSCKKDETVIQIADSTATADVKLVEDTCMYCGGLYVHGMHINCPHCGASIPPSGQDGIINTTDVNSDFYMGDTGFDGFDSSARGTFDGINGYDNYHF